jgi:flagellar basal-body rod protein FlgF
MNIGVYQSASSLTALERWQDTVAQNLTSAQTNGYRKRTVEFSTETAGKWTLNPKARFNGAANQQPAQFTRSTGGINFVGGEIQTTRNELDVALQGDGFFELQDRDGTRLYTRNGEFRLTRERTIVGPGGMAVLTEDGVPLTTLPGGGAISINPDGIVSQANTVIGRLSIQRFADPASLVPVGGGTFVAGAGVEPTPVEKPDVMQGYLEQSNVKPLREMVDLILISRAYEANQKIISSAEQNMEKTLQALG